jgi:hypothetical protein
MKPKMTHERAKIDSRIADTVNDGPVGRQPVRAIGPDQRAIGPEVRCRKPGATTAG